MKSIKLTAMNNNTPEQNIKKILKYTRELVLALIFALVIATLVRQVWFELYEIPSGSMRPTFREQDRLTVTKTAFGINMPLQTNHLYFDPTLVLRGGIVIWSGDGVPVLETESTYFGIFPSVKRYIKRCIGKPGDSLYFYGGRIYAVDAEGHDLTELRESPWMTDLEHIPFLGFEGKISLSTDSSILLKQMYRPAGKLSSMDYGLFYGEVFNGKEWVRDNPIAQKTPHATIQTYSDFFGMRNFAMARLLTAEELKSFPDVNIDDLEEGVLYLQLRHTPSLSYPKPIIGNGVSIPAYSTVIPLQQHHLDSLMDHLYTTRFIVHNGKGMRYGEESLQAGAPSFTGVPDGTYEFYHGKGSEIHMTGITTELSQTSPLYDRTPSNIQKLFNLGIEMNNAFTPKASNKTLFPHRYAYFRDGDLFIMGAHIINKDDPALQTFHKREQQREEKAKAQQPYVAFKDYGAPIKNGKIDINFIRTFGYTVPPHHYFVLGDNHAMSLDSRVFGSIPEENLQGAPCCIFWPPSDRMGSPPQAAYPFLNLPRVIIWLFFGIAGMAYYIYQRQYKKNKKIS